MSMTDDHAEEFPDRPESRPSREGEDSLLAALLDELTTAKRSGQELDLELAEHRYPALAEDLRSLWATVSGSPRRCGSCSIGGMRDSKGQRGPVDETVEVTSTNGPAPDGRPPARLRSTVESGRAAPRGRVFGDYELFEELGRGGMGIVARAIWDKGCRVVALKRLLSGPESSPQDVERFRAEIRAASSLSHPYIVPVFDLGECDGQPYFTMKYASRGRPSRKATLADGPMTAIEASRLLGPDLPSDPVCSRQWGYSTATSSPRIS